MSAATISLGVASKPTIRAPNFGQWLKHRRGKKRSLESVAGKVRAALARHQVQFHRSTLFRIEEEGIVPHLLVITQLAHIYRVPVGSLVERLASELGLRDEDSSTLPEDPLPSDDALALARWFDDLPVERRKGVLTTLGVGIEDRGIDRARKRG